PHRSDGGGLPRQDAPLRARQSPILAFEAPPSPRQGAGRRKGLSSSIAQLALEERELARARGVRHVRHPLRRPPRPAPHPHVSAVRGVSVAQGLSAQSPPADHPGARSGGESLAAPSTGGRAMTLPDESLETGS